MTNHVNVLIATPGRSMEAEYVKSLVETINYLSSNNITFRYLNQYSPQVNMAREATIMDSRYLDAFNKSPVLGQVTYDKIIWIDSDISWDVKDFMSIYNSEKDITSGVYLNEYGIPMFSVEDQGPGMDDKQMAALFNPFVRAGKGFSSRIEGTGLGLTIANRLARLLGGFIRVTTKLKAGSCFSLFLPRIEAQMKKIIFFFLYIHIYYSFKLFVLHLYL